jgi:hypothetical protein
MISLAASLLFGIDSACVSAALRTHYSEDCITWQIPLSFAVCDGLGSYLGILLHARKAVGYDTSLATIFASYALVVAVLLILAKRPRATVRMGFRRKIILIAIPLLLSVENLFGGEILPGIWTPESFAVATFVASYVMSVFGLFLGDVLRHRIGAVRAVAVLLVASHLIS